jgi:hypothetical protein
VRTFSTATKSTPADRVHHGERPGDRSQPHEVSVSRYYDWDEVVKHSELVEFGGSGRSGDQNMAIPAFQDSAGLQIRFSAHTMMVVENN